MCLVTSRPLSVDAAYRAVRREDCGAICAFIGTVRNVNEGKAVRCLSYSAFEEMAARECEKIVIEARRRWDLGALYVAHRTGIVDPAEPSVVIAVSASHRAEAFAACRFVIERLKRTAPIWKEEFYARGKSWVGSRPASGR
ncbi:MAG: molybdenum cofactor biosynthesis protein MoaE [Planctomycetes bacterium]|nr:molybdenum cofactor biosynthesis protein MoaE [Planctomycetota bacterium]